MPRQMSGTDVVLFRAVVIMTWMKPDGTVRAFAPVVLGPHETTSPVKAAVTRYKNAAKWDHEHAQARARRLGEPETELGFTVDFQKTPIVWESVKVDA